MDVYDALQEVLDSHPSTAPAAPAFSEILRILFSEDEAALAVNMSFSAMPLERIAALAEVPEARALQLLEAMADRGVLIGKQRPDGGHHYALVPTIPGLFEFPFMKADPPQAERLAKLWEVYHAQALGASFSGHPTPLMRVVPVNKSIEVRNEVKPYEEVVDLIRRSEAIALTNCACRTSVKGCDAPLDVCLFFDKPAKAMAARGFAKLIEVDEAITVLDRAEEAGLVHTTNNSADRATVICSCCPCCCTVLRGRTQLGIREAFSASAFLPEVDAAACTGCGICADERCPVSAIAVPDEIAVVDQDACIGCGLCVSGCPADALHLVRRADEAPVPETVAEMALTAANEKGRLERFFAVMARANKP
jgi:H+/Na+-translocating ferredoxin:NAD+ oxidoreductase subunit B